MIDTSGAFDSIFSVLNAETDFTTLDVEDDEQVEKVAGVVKPYVILNMGSPVRSGTDRGIVGSARDVHKLWLSVTCVSEKMSVSRKLKDRVIGLLVDFEPTDSGRLTLDGGLQYPIAKTSVLPKRYADVAVFTFAHNLQN